LLHTSLGETGRASPHGFRSIHGRRWARQPGEIRTPTKAANPRPKVKHDLAVVRRHPRLLAADPFRPAEAAPGPHAATSRRSVVAGGVAKNLDVGDEFARTRMRPTASEALVCMHHSALRQAGSMRFDA
jgi:hypothetical protein